MDLTKILEYQRIDAPIYKEQALMKKSNEAQRYALLKSQQLEFTTALGKMDTEAGELFRKIKALSDSLDALIAEDKTDFSFNIVTDMSQVDNIDSALGEYSNEISNLEKNISKLFKRLSEISAESAKTVAKLQAIVAELKNLKVAIDEMKKALIAKFKNELSALSALEKEIDPALLAKYKERRDKKRIPAFVRYIGGSCEGCGMNVEAEINGKLKEQGDVGECPHCRRILFVE